MTRRSSRIGKFRDQNTLAKETSSLATFPDQNVSIKEILITSYRGKAPPQHNKFSFEDFQDCSIILMNRDRIYKNILKGRSRATLKVLKKALRFIATYFQWLQDRHGINVYTPDDIDLNTSSLVYVFLRERNENYNKINFFRRFLRTIGVPEENIPLNTYISSSSDPADVVAIELIVKMYNHFKSEALIVMSRAVEFEELRFSGHDPRRSHGGNFGDWASLANRIYVVLHVIGTEIKLVNNVRAGGLRTPLAGLENYPGAMVLRENGEHKRKKGLTGHLAYLYPSERDLLPFVCLLLIKTRFNVSVIMGLKIGTYVFRPVAFQYGKGERVIQFAALKFRTVNDSEAEPSYVHCLSLVKPYGHPYKIIKFLEKLTHPIRMEAKRTIAELKSRPSLNETDEEYLKSLETIKDDLFLYSASGRIGSLGKFAEIGSSPSVFTDSMVALGFPTSLGGIRKAALAHGSNLSGANQSIVTLLGDHKNNRSAISYRNRKQLHHKWQSLFIDVFELSISLIEIQSFTKQNLKLILGKQGLTAREIENLLDEGSLTKWGNRCSDPLAPPPGFDVGTEKGKRCVGQACIDGCSRARWFPDVLKLVERQRIDLTTRLTAIPFAAGAYSVIHDRIERCEKIIATIKSQRGTEK